MSTTFIALDPGGTTGWARYRPSDAEGKQFLVGQIGPNEHHNKLYEFLELQESSHYVIICESFEFRQRVEDAARTNIELTSKEYIGVVKLYGQQHPLTSVVFQTAGAAKGFIPDKPRNGLEANAKLKIMGLYVPAHKHAMDAMRHLIYHLVNTQGMTHLIRPWKDL